MWKVLDEGDPVTLIWIEDTGEHKELGLYDRDHAIRMIKRDSTKCYIKEDDSESQPTIDRESELINQILKDGQERWITPTRSTPKDYQQAIQKAKRYGLLKAVSKDSFEVTEEGQKAFDLGGFDRWKEIWDHSSQSRYDSIIIGGNVVIGNNNSDVTQGHNLSKSSPINTVTQQSQHSEKSIKKSEHSAWDKIKYISVIVGGLSALIVGLAKVFGWW
ncbi:hypothetical protein GCM10023189_06880 [Nibrella saemangeumensis]|uniref:Uncharacterized protein n=1 Tax=Nibrella saemangeumensis TaxID=1084526 RepID=A0ABP8MDR9_9BACT